MSGLEIIGVVASTLQIAEIGMRLSVKLCSFYRQIKDADRSAERLANDVSLTCSILHQLGRILEQDIETKVCSEQAFLTAREVLNECKKIFKQIEDAVEKKDPGSGKTKWERGTRRLTIVVLGPDLDVLKSHLDRLKSTMLLMLNVIIYARDIKRSCHDSSLESQRQLIETLLHEKTKADAGTNHPNEPGSGNSPQFTMMAEPIQATSHGFSPDSEIDKYHNLVRSLLKEIDACQAILPQDRHVRIRDGVLAIHEAELAIFLDSHGEAAMRTFDSPLFKRREPFKFNKGDHSYPASRPPRKKTSGRSHSIFTPVDDQQSMLSFHSANPPRSKSSQDDPKTDTVQKHPPDRIPASRTDTGVAPPRRPKLIIDIPSESCVQSSATKKPFLAILLPSSSPPMEENPSTGVHGPSNPSSPNMRPVSTDSLDLGPRDTRIISGYNSGDSINRIKRTTSQDFYVLNKIPDSFGDFSGSYGVKAAFPPAPVPMNDLYDSDDAMNRSPLPVVVSPKFEPGPSFDPFPGADATQTSGRERSGRSDQLHQPETQLQTRYGESVLASRFVPSYPEIKNILLSWTTIAPEDIHL